MFLIFWIPCWCVRYTCTILVNQTISSGALMMAPPFWLFSKRSAHTCQCVEQIVQKQTEKYFDMKSWAKKLTFVPEPSASVVISYCLDNKRLCSPELSHGFCGVIACSCFVLRCKLLHIKTVGGISSTIDQKRRIDWKLFCIPWV